MTVLSLKGSPVPQDGTGVVIFDDIGGYLGSNDGLICNATANWSYPNGTLIRNSPSINVFGVSTPGCSCTCDATPQGVSLYYSGKPAERGKFQCIHLEFYPFNIDVVKYPVYIVDMNIIGPTPVGPTLVGSKKIFFAGDRIQLCINVTTTPEEVPVPYQWSMNGAALQPDDKYQGTRGSTLTVSNVQAEDQGSYSCRVAHSVSGNTNHINLTVGELISLANMQRTLY